MACTKTTAGTEIREARLRRGWNLADVAQAIRRHPDLDRRYWISDQAIDNIEKGKVRNPHVRTKFAIATVLGFDLFHLWPEG